MTPMIFVILLYLLHSMAELCFSPVGLSSMTRMATSSMVGLMMGTWFLATAAGNFMAAKIAQATGGEGAGPERVLEVYSTIGWYIIVVGLVSIPVSLLIKRLMHLDQLGERRNEELAGYKQVGEREAAGMFPDRETKPDDKPL
jgi:POT family proton-dependent oligopeptide transporter